MKSGASSRSSNSRGPAYALIDRSAAWFHRVLFSCLLLVSELPSHTQAASGCADGTREGLHSFENTAACEGVWSGHVSNASGLCAPGWRVCTSFDVSALRNITWQHALEVKGCMAINAAQDGGRCRECRDDLAQDDMAGLGQGCPHQNIGQTSCISGGRIDASCCVDSHFHTACHFKPGHMTGVVCCRLPVKRPNIVVKPPERLQVFKDFIFLLSCQASGMPPPRVLWYKDGRRLRIGNSHVSVHRGDLVVTRAGRKDTGLYTCEAINEQGIDMASSYVRVAVFKSGCADGSTDGLHLRRDIQACTGMWKGHVRFGKSLCAKGWRVCSPKNEKALKKLKSREIYALSGCYAYNSAGRKNKCRKCTPGTPMSGVGRDCGYISNSHRSCLDNRRIDVFPQSMKQTCEYRDGHTTGVLCCKRPKKRKAKMKCKPPCANGGVCSVNNRCQCARGYKGARCQLPICVPDCGSKGKCVRPNKCRCEARYTGPTCRLKSKRCTNTCLNGGRCRKGQCKCPTKFVGKSCQYLALQHVLLSRMNRTEK